VSIVSLLLAAASLAAGARPSQAPSCAGRPSWNTPQRPFRVYGNTYYVGTRCLSAVLVTSPAGHVLIDAGLPTSAALVRANIAALGFRVADVRLIVNSHAHDDHAGGIAAVQRASGAAVAASPASARVLRGGASRPDDPQYGIAPRFPRVRRVRALTDGETVRLGPVALTAHWTPGHTPGGTTWSWTSCEGSRCLSLVYADSQTPVSADGFAYTRSTSYPSALDDFARGHAVLDSLPCDVLITPHPEASGLWERVTDVDGDGGRVRVDRGACQRYATAARRQLATRVATERGAR
jgi:metallo-beta-lactamase class B